MQADGGSIEDDGDPGEVAPGVSIIETTADVGLHVDAATLDQLFERAAVGLLAVMRGDAVVCAVVERLITVRAEDRETLLVAWLQRLLYEFDGEGMLYAEFSCRVQEREMQARCRGERFDLHRHFLETEIKAVTYHRLRVEESGDGWVAEVILDV
ncbi:archease [bacterium]|nr:archease [candidate division CSSED10-310 bacterium]